MFSDTLESVSFGLQFVARQREKDVALQGFTKVLPPKKATKLKKLPRDMNHVNEMVQKALKHHEDLLHGLCVRIHHTTKLAQVKLRTEDEFMACVTMMKAKEIQQEYIRAFLIRSAIQMFEEHMWMGLVGARTATKDLAAITHIHKETAKLKRDPDDVLLAQLNKEAFFPIIKVYPDRRFDVFFSNIPPICNHEVGIVHAKNIATRGFSTVRVPTGYLKTENPSSKQKAVIAIISQAREQQETTVQSLIKKIKMTVNQANVSLKDSDKEAVYEAMRRVKDLQQEYLHALRVIEGLNAYENFVLRGIVDLAKAKGDIEDLNSTGWEPTPSECSNEDLLAELEEKKFYPRLFPILGGGVKVYFSENPPSFTRNTDQNKA